MLKKAGRYVAEKVTQNVASIIVTWGFWTTVCFIGPTAIVGTVGGPAFAVATIAAHSGIVEYVAVRSLSNLLITESEGK